MPTYKHSSNQAYHSSQQTSLAVIELLNSNLDIDDNNDDDNPTSPPRRRGTTQSRSAPPELPLTHTNNNSNKQSRRPLASSKHTIIAGNYKQNGSSSKTTHAATDMSVEPSDVDGIRNEIEWKSNPNDFSLICTFDFWNNVHLIQRFLLFFVCIILIILSTFYAIGQITKLSLENYFCENKTLEEIYQHSREYNLTEGTRTGCWHSKGIIVNEDALYSSDAFIISSDISFWNVLKCIIFICCSLGLFYCFVYNLLQFYKDFFVRYPKRYFHPRYVICDITVNYTFFFHV